MHLYLIKRGPRPDFHKAPYHPVIICACKDVAKWEVGATSAGAWLWEKESDPSSGWLLGRWNGLDLDYGHIVHGFKLPDGTPAAFQHDRKAEPWTLLAGAVWWSDKPIPGWLMEKGVVYPPDEFTQKRILQVIEWSNEAKRPYGPWPDVTAPHFWPKETKVDV